jgi:hypothetical protein
MSKPKDILYISDDQGHRTGVILPIDLWLELAPASTGEGSSQKLRLDPKAAWKDLIAVAGEVATQWRSPKSVVDLVEEQRR